MTLKKLNIRTGVLVFSAAACLAIATSLFVTNRALHYLGMEGPIFADINSQKDLIADILPPPLYVVEAYSLAYESYLHPERRDAAFLKIDALRKEFNTRRDYWKTVDLPITERMILEDRVEQKGDAFWTVLVD